MITIIMIIIIIIVTIIIMILVVIIVTRFQQCIPCTYYLFLLYPAIVC
jgi:hypothetical protein